MMITPTGYLIFWGRNDFIKVAKPLPAIALIPTRALPRSYRVPTFFQCPVRGYLFVAFDHNLIRAPLGATQNLQGTLLIRNWVAPMGHIINLYWVATNR
jgi:hypothetical protein